MLGGPIIFEEPSSKTLLEKFKKETEVRKIIDVYEKQLHELFEITYPSLIGTNKFNQELKKFVQDRKESGNTIKGSWIYFPWSKKLLHSLKNDELKTLRTNRNRDLITLKEQEKLQEFCVGIAGLSVGSNIATALVFQGISRNLKLAEFDVLETTNLNRIRANLSDIGRKKTDVLTEQIYEIDPYINLVLYSEGLNDDSINSFVSSEPKPNLIFEIIDNFEMKVKLRLKAREHRIPVIMLANLGDSILVDIERFDLNPNLELFNGLLGKLPEQIAANPTEDANKYAVQIVGLENIPKRAMESVAEIKKTLVGRPQLTSTVTIAGGLAAYITRKIALNETTWSGRRKFSIDSFFN